MAEVIFPGPAGRVEGRYIEGARENGPIALILHPHPKAGGSMQDRVAVQLFKIFQARGFAVLRFNFRGIGRSQGVFDNGMGELSDAASALDYLQSLNPNAEKCWVAGYSFGAWIGLQLLMRRPEIDGFIAVSPPANHYDLSFLAPCPASGLVVYGSRDQVAPPSDVERAVSKIRTQKNIKVDASLVEAADHFYRTPGEKNSDLLPEMEKRVSAYLDKRLAAPPTPAPVGRRG
ncbi:MAG: alpha/beta hydrolase [Hyphomonadaceae bacterium]